MRRGKFITFEGIEGCGKTTQITLLKGVLQKLGYKVMVTREPGGSRIGDAIREILLNPRFNEMRPMTELLLYVAGRTQHYYQIILPALKQGKMVLCDRFADSTRAYQGAARAIEPKLIEHLHRIAIDSFKPDKTLLLDLSVREGRQRIQKRKLDRLEKEALAFHRRVRQGYLKLAKREPRRIRVIPAGAAVQTVHQNILKIIASLLP